MIRDTVLFLINQTTRFISPVEVAAEWVLVAVAVLLAALIPCNQIQQLRTLKDAFHKLANRRLASILICALLPVAVRLSLLGLIPVPDPSIHDEFSHLLLGDTLSHGRLANSTHPMWEHFETIHVIQRPSYASMYPPGQGIFLAFGQVVFHEPWAGVVISVGLMFGALCWMMQGWLSPAWALYGTLIAILKFGLTGLWINSYLSGAVPGIGGALLLAALPRLRNRPRVSHAILLGIGVVILMNTRPFEGAVLTLAASAYLVSELRHSSFVRAVTQVAIPAGVVITAGVLFTGYYNWRVTGTPLRMPYQVNRDTYGWPENLAFLPPKNLTLRHPVLEAMYEKEIHNRDAYSSPARVMDSLDTRVYENWAFFAGPVLTIPLLLFPWVVRDRRVRWLLIFVSIIAVLNLFQLVLYPYHLGPIVPAMFVLIAQSMRHLYVAVSRWKHRRELGVAVLLPACLIVVAALKQQAPGWAIPMTYWEVATEPHRDARAYIESWLSARPMKHLVIVRYKATHSPNQEWVYNQADIDASKVVWAREMDPESDARLIRYFADRQIWLVEADVLPQHVVRYPGPQPEAANKKQQ